MKAKKYLSINAFARAVKVPVSTIHYHVVRGHIPLTEYMVTVKGIDPKEVKRFIRRIGKN